MVNTRTCYCNNPNCKEYHKIYAYDEKLGYQFCPYCGSKLVCKSEKKYKEYLLSIYDLLIFKKSNKHIDSIYFNEDYAYDEFEYFDTDMDTTNIPDNYYQLASRIVKINRESLSNKFSIVKFMNKIKQFGLYEVSFQEDDNNNTFIRIELNFPTNNKTLAGGISILFGNITSKDIDDILLNFNRELVDNSWTNFEATFLKDVGYYYRKYKRMEILCNNLSDNSKLLLECS